jgi:transcriptional regulator with XRE-family HTH domain
LTVEELAEESGVLFDSLYLYERGRSTPSVTLRIALTKTLGVSFDALAELVWPARKPFKRVKAAARR